MKRSSIPHEATEAQCLGRCSALVEGEGVAAHGVPGRGSRIRHHARAFRTRRTFGGSRCGQLIRDGTHGRDVGWRPIERRELGCG
jgi:hypothetical protein